MKMRRLNILSVCTEFGSEVQAFTDRGHNVITLGIGGDVDINQDVRNVHFYHSKGYYDFVTCHPPCTEFSKANWRLGECKKRKPDLSIVEACFRIINELKPRFSIVENPQGCLRHFIGKPQYCIKYGDFSHYCQKPTDLWGVLPFFQAMNINTVVKGKHSVTAYTNGTRRADQRALLPYGLSLALCLAMEDAHD